MSDIDDRDPEPQALGTVPDRAMAWALERQAKRPTVDDRDPGFEFWIVATVWDLPKAWEDRIFTVEQAAQDAAYQLNRRDAIEGWKAHRFIAFRGLRVVP